MSECAGTASGTELFSHGHPCVRCGSTVRYAVWRRCVPCERQRQRKNAGKLKWLPPFLIDGVKVLMAPVERDIFAALYNARGAQVPVEKLYDAGWGCRHDPPLSIQTSLWVRITYLRRALEPTQFRIVTDWGRGYRMVRLDAAEMAA